METSSSSPTPAPSQAPSAPLLQVRDLCKSYGPRTILDGVSFELARGETLVILGRSGTGKSVTLRHLNGLLLSISAIRRGFGDALF